MKKALMIVALLSIAREAHPQGTITFFSLKEATAYYYQSGQVPFPSDRFIAGLFLASDLFTPLGTTDFIPGTGFFNAIDVVVPGRPVGDSTSSYVVRVWEKGKTYATSNYRSEHFPFTSGPLGGQNLPNPPLPPPDLGPNFLGIFMTVPEPSTYALAIAGLGPVAIIRRRK
jgi:hypothetical protein